MLTACVCSLPACSTMMRQNNFNLGPPPPPITLEELESERKRAFLFTVRK